MNLFLARRGGAARRERDRNRYRQSQTEVETKSQKKGQNETDRKAMDTEKGGFSDLRDIRKQTEPQRQRL